MGSESPDVILYSSDGIEIAVQNNTATPVGTRGILNAGSDGTTSRVLAVDTSGRQVVVGAAASGSAISGNPVLIAGSDGTNARTLTTNSVNGSQVLLVQDAEDLRATYSGSILAFAAPASATDIFTIIGSATKIVRVIRLEVSATITTAATVSIQIVKRSSANTAPTAITATPHDSLSAAATASVGNYTTNPATLGTQVGSPIRSFKLFVPAPATTSTPQPIYEVDFGIQNDQPIVLRGIAQCLSVNLNATTLTGNSFAISVVWTEDTV